MLKRTQEAYPGRKEVQQPNVQENNISKIQKIIPISGHSESKANESDSTTTAMPLEDEFFTSTKYPQETTDSYNDTTMSSANVDSIDTGAMETTTMAAVDIYVESIKDSNKESRFTSESQVIDETTPIYPDDSTAPESFNDSTTYRPETTTSSETTTSEIENTTKEEPTTESSVPDVPFVVPINTWLEGLTTSVPITTDNPQVGPFEEENDQQNEAQEGDVVALAGAVNDGNNPEEENKQSVNSQDGVQSEDNRSPNGDELKNEGPSVDASYNQGDLSIGNVDDVEENRNTNKNRLHSENANPGETVAPVVMSGEEQYSASDEPADETNQEVSPQDQIPQIDLTTAAPITSTSSAIKDVRPVEASTSDDSSGGGAGILMRKRQKRFNYGQQCTPVSLDAYSLDSVSVCGSVRRKGVIRSSKRSYGNAGFDDPTTPSHPMGFAGLANFVTNRQAMEEEFASIPHVTANVDDLPEGADTKNRYSNVIPLPETRVPLTLRDGEPLSDYINANFVHGPKNASKYYIACQAPLPTTVTDFWRMVWEQQSKAILMLTDLMENGVNLETNSWREVKHFWYVSWPAQGVPDDISSVIAFLLEARPHMQGGPCVIHCSPGTGRTGTVIASDLCIRDFETSRIVDIPQCVAKIRRERAGAVQTRDQYVINLYGTKLTGSALDSM
ncbi:hypothetical protein C0J52_05324 [Blattella germanica]|nr:hypothetical protein C0J52_05324 [Blattella germanica]